VRSQKNSISLKVYQLYKLTDCKCNRSCNICCFLRKKQNLIKWGLKFLCYMRFLLVDQLFPSVHVEIRQAKDIPCWPWWCNSFFSTSMWRCVIIMRRIWCEYHSCFLAAIMIIPYMICKNIYKINYLAVKLQDQLR
jgi:hypothetical protein